MGRIALHKVKLTEFGRVADSSGWFKFASSPGSSLPKLCKDMSWIEPGEHDKKKSVEGEFEGGHFVFVCRDKIGGDVEIEVEYTKISGFELHRLELEGRKGKGFRWEVRFKGKYNCQEGAANMESYMMRTDNSPGSLTIMFVKKPKQNVLPLADDAQGTLIDEGEPKE